MEITAYPHSELLLVQTINEGPGDEPCPSCGVVLRAGESHTHEQWVEFPHQAMSRKLEIEELKEWRANHPSWEFALKDMTIQRDEARALATRLAEALRKTLGFSLPSKPWLDRSSIRQARAALADYEASRK